ncbi:MAG: phosphatidylinositol mannoside acyltransferase [Nitriliruptoraceae bacterium]
MTLSRRLAYWRYLAAWEAAARLPDRLAATVPGKLGPLWYRAASPAQRAQVRRNLARVRPTANERELTDLVRAAYVSYARYWLDSFRLHRMDAGRVVSGSAGQGSEYLDVVRDGGHGGIVATAHLGSWDVGALFSAHRGWRMVVVAEVVEPRPLFERFVRLREGAGIGVIPLVRGGDVLGELERQVTEEAALATLLADRDLTRRGPIVSFFGEPCRIPAGPAVLARRTGLPVHIGAFVTVGDGFRAVIRPPVAVAHLDVLDAAQVVADELEQLIGAYPEQWHVFVRNWLAEREPDHPVVEAWRAGRDWRPLARADRDEGPGGTG